MTFLYVQISLKTTNSPFPQPWKNVLVDFLQTGQETDFVLVSCTGLGVEPSRREQVLKAKRVSLSLSSVLYIVSKVHFIFVFPQLSRVYIYKFL